MPEDLKLNSISRFSKASPRLHLEEHGSCEIPAGCGGVVLRWYNPANGVPVLFLIHASSRARVFINGIEPTSARPLVPLGSVVLAIEFDAVASDQALFILAGVHSKSFAVNEQSTCVVRSVPDGSWRFNVTSPSAGWRLPDFDDGAWPELIARQLDLPEADDYRGRHAYERLVRFGASPLGLPPKFTAAQVRVRKVFTNTRE
jgi:hypothetical protein